MNVFSLSVWMWTSRNTTCQPPFDAFLQFAASLEWTFLLVLNDHYVLSSFMFQHNFSFKFHSFHSHFVQHKLYVNTVKSMASPFPRKLRSKMAKEFSSNQEFGSKNGFQWIVHYFRKLLRMNTENPVIYFDSLRTQCLHFTTENQNQVHLHNEEMFRN